MMHWRLATDGDGDAIVAMCLDLYTEDPGLRSVSASDVRRTLQVFTADAARGRVAVLDATGRCAGYAFLVPYWSNEVGGEICIIDELYVEPSARGKGYASELLQALTSGAEPFHPRPVALELESTPNNSRARSLYLRLGFKEKRNTTLRLVLTTPP